MRVGVCALTRVICIQACPYMRASVRVCISRVRVYLCIVGWFENNYYLFILPNPYSDPIKPITGRFLQSLLQT